MLIGIVNDLCTVFGDALKKLCVSAAHQFVLPGEEDGMVCVRGGGDEL